MAWIIPKKSDGQAHPVDIANVVCHESLLDHSRRDVSCCENTRALIANEGTFYLGLGSIQNPVCNMCSTNVRFQS